MMRLIVIVVIVLLPLLTWRSRNRPGGRLLPAGWMSSGSFCVPRADAQDAIPLPPSGTCPWSWTRNGSFRLRSGSQR